MSALSFNQYDQFEADMQSCAALIDDKISHLLPDKATLGAAIHQAMRYAALSPGKRFRGFLILKMAPLFGVAFNHAIRVAAAVEMLHSYSLIHDDLPAMDDADLRRGIPSTHKKFDEATAILAGDALLTYCFEILADSLTHPDPDIRTQLILELTKAVGAQGMALGQMMDMEAEVKDLTFAQMQELQHLKTGRLIEFSAIACALMSKASDKKRDAVLNYGFFLGRAFQIADDILDEEASLSDLGKPIGQDKEKGKQSYISFLGMDKAKAEAKEMCEKAIGFLSVFHKELEEKSQSLKDLAYYTIERKK